MQNTDTCYTGKQGIKSSEQHSKKLMVVFALVTVAILSLAAKQPTVVTSQPKAEFVPATQANVFAQQRTQLTDAQMDNAMLGRSFFHIPWVVAPSATTARDGLGPLFNANTCASCHINNGASMALNDAGQPRRSLVFKLAQPSKHNQRLINQIAVADPNYGLQVAINGTGAVNAEAKAQLIHQTQSFSYADGQTLTLTRFVPKLSQLNYGALAPDTRIGLRQAPALVGLSLVTQLDEHSLLAHADPEDSNGDGISGRIHYVYDKQTGKLAVGKYGWRASQPTLLQQTADAAANDMGLTNPLYPKELCTQSQTACQQAPTGRLTPMGNLDLPMLRLQAIRDYLTSFKAPTAVLNSQQAKRGQRLFGQIGCSQCHVNQMTTKNGVTFAPYSDYLLHDMGEALADDRLEFDASRQEWRTAPLWGIGERMRQQQRFLHDARADNPEQAIVWHGGEAHRAQQAFVNLQAADRQAVLAFLANL